MAVNRGKQFENVIRKSFECVEGVSIDRINDNTAGFKGIAGICDFIVYKYPYQYYIECKTIHGNTFPLSNITDTQYNGLVEKDKIGGVRAGLIIWWVDKDVTKFVPISTVQTLKANKYKSISYNLTALPTTEIKGKKKRVFFDYDMTQFFIQVGYDYKIQQKEREILNARIKRSKR